FVAGAKYRFTGPHNPIGLGVVAYYKWYADKGDDLSGFNQLQRGASPGANFGDIAVIFVADGRLSRSVNVSANVGYKWNSNPKDANDIVLLDRPDEVISGIGLDFPINRHVQPIAELRSTWYVAGHTPNAFNNNPVEVLGGVKYYPRRWFELGGWVRYHLNQQSLGHFNARDFNVPINQISVGGVSLPQITRPSTSGGAPLGFVESDNPWGFGGQVSVMHVNK